MGSNPLIRQIHFHFFYNLNRNRSYICFTNSIIMGRTNFLGEFEELILTMVLILDDNAYGNTIVKSIKDHQKREVNLSSVHITLYRLEEKGLLESSMGGATQERGGRKKRYFRITNAGKALLQEMKDSRTSLWKMAPQLNFSS